MIEFNVSILKNVLQVIIQLLQIIVSNIKVGD